MDDLPNYKPETRADFLAMPLLDRPPYEKPRAWRAIRASGTYQLVSTTDNRFAVGKKIRVGTEIPADAQYFDTQAQAEKHYDKVTKYD